jgi:hypothetical protein
MLKILQVAISQIGTTEDKLHTNHGDAIKYQDAAGLPKGGGFPWCMSFVFWCGKQAYESANPIPQTGGVLECLRVARLHVNCHVVEHLEATPENILPGMQGIMQLSATTGHTFVIESVDIDGTLHTIEGNSNDNGSRDGYEVCRQNKRHITDKAIIAFIRYDYPDAEVV